MEHTEWSLLTMVHSHSSEVGVAKVPPDTGSNHSPVIATTNVGVARLKKDEKRRIERDWKNIDKEGLEIFLLSWDWQPVFDSKNVNTIPRLIN